MVTLQNILYTHTNKDLLFQNINLSVNNHDRIALIGNNGSGKSTLLKIIAGQLLPRQGNIQKSATPYYIPQVFGQFNQLTIGQATKIDRKLNALKEILEGRVTEANLTVLDDDWTIEERCKEALSQWGIGHLSINQKMETLSGGEKTKVFLAGIAIHQPELVLLDEPSNHLDVEGRMQLYNFIKSTSCTLIVVSHDRALLNILNQVCELHANGISIYGGNYDFYMEQKQLAQQALNQNIQSKAKALRKAKESERESMERKQKLDARGKNKQGKAGVAKIMMNTLRNNAENSMAKLKDVHAEKVETISKELRDLRGNVSKFDKIKFGLDDAVLHNGKILVNATNINFNYGNKTLWKKDLNFQIRSGGRIAFKGTNGSGKTTLIKLILGILEPTRGTLQKLECSSLYIDQDYSLINNSLNVYEQANSFNTDAFLEHEIKIRLNWFLFGSEDWNKPCSTLSGGERMRLMLCCLTISKQAPDVIVLDEPTNNLDIQNIEILTKAINDYRGTVIVVSHDSIFLEEIGIASSIFL